ncbi:tetratricopeptide repeat protein, partial [Planctomycetota bacterium]
TTTPPVLRRIPRALIFGLIVCVIIICVFSWWLLPTKNDRPKEAKQSLDSSQSKAATSELTLEEEIAALKKEEMELARHVLTEFPKSDGSCMLMGDLYARHGNSTEAVKFWEKSLEINPKHFDALRNMGGIALEKEQFDQAVTFLRKALEIKPDAAGLRSDIAKALMDSGDYVEAITELEQEIKVSPSSFTAHFQLAEAYRQQKEYDKAIERYEQTIRLEPEHRHAHYGLAMVYTRMGQRDNAQEYLSAFRKLRDKVDSIYSTRQVGPGEDMASLRASVVKTYLDAERLYRDSGNTAKAEEVLNRASGLDPNNTRCLERLASLYYTTNCAAKALECFEKIARINPNNPISYLNIGQVATRLKMFEKAERAFRQTIALAPNNPAGYIELARFYLRTNTKAAQAYGLAQKAIALKTNAETYFLLGWAADVNGDRDSALQAIEQAIKLQPKNQKYRQIYERIKKKN